MRTAHYVSRIRSQMAIELNLLRFYAEPLPDARTVGLTDAQVSIHKPFVVACVKFDASSLLALTACVASIALRWKPPFSIKPAIDCF